MSRTAAAVAHEEGLALFLVPRVPPRFRSAMADERLRVKFLRRLAHFRELDHRFAELVSPAARNAAHLARELRRRGATELCFVVSEGELDGCQLRLEDVLAEIVDGESPAATFISCVPGQLAYFHDEPPHEDDYILDRRDAG